jgi:hypothetical protein
MYYFWFCVNVGIMVKKNNEWNLAYFALHNRKTKRIKSEHNKT